MRCVAGKTARLARVIDITFHRAGFHVFDESFVCVALLTTVTIRIPRVLRVSAKPEGMTGLGSTQLRSRDWIFGISTVTFSARVGQYGDYVHLIAPDELNYIRFAYRASLGLSSGKRCSRDEDKRRDQDKQDSSYLTFVHSHTTLLKV
jgi:hypothetical protein